MVAMNLNHLIAFIKVVQTKSFKAAAKQLNVTQPAISMRIQSLEDHFGTKLVTRLSDGVQLTTAGEQAYKQAQAILHHWEELEIALKVNKTAGTIKLGASTIPSEYLLPSLLKDFKQTYPEMQINTFVAGSHDVINWLIDGTVDVIITGKQKPNTHIVSKQMYEDELVIIVPPHMNVSDQPKHIDDFIKHDWVLREPNSNTRKVWEEVFVKKGLLEKLQIVAQMGSNEAVIGAVEAGLGISVVSSLAAARAARYGRVQVIDSEVFSIKRPFYLSTLKENIRQPMIETFLEFALDKIDKDLKLN